MFFNISGLKISVTKTKAIWFGKAAEYTHRLCPDIPLIWDNKFRLLGIDFDNTLSNMERNFDLKMEEIRNLLCSWKHRKLTSYGKIVVIKTLALSKLSHAALVIESINDRKVKDFERMLSKFLWKTR